MKPKILRAPQKSDLSPLQLKVGIVLILVAALIISGVYLNYQSTGQAISFRQGLQQVNLVKYGELEIRAPPTGALLLFLNTSISSAQEELIYRFILQKRDESSFTVILINNETNTLIAQDILFPGGSSSLIYLSDTDTLPDLEISLAADSSLKITNLHYTQPDASKITFLDVEGLPYDALIHAETNNYVNGTINASSSFAPRVGVKVIPVKYNESLTLIPIVPPAVNKDTMYKIIFNTTGVPSDAVVLDITATVQNQETHAYYTLAIGEVVYALRQDGFPVMTLIQNERERNARVSVTLAATTELQPFALPCEFIGTADQLFTNLSIKKVYTFNNGVPQVWTQGEAPDDFSAVVPGRGYFIELREASSVEISAECTIRPLPPVIVPPSFGGALRRSERLARGWNLISLPGITPRSLTTLTLDWDYDLFQCSQGYRCSSLPIDALLEPGKPYWVFARSDHITLPLVVE